jgi:hypothetical protein
MALKMLADDGTLEALAQKYFTEEFTLTYDDIGPGAYGEDE